MILHYQEEGHTFNRTSMELKQANLSQEQFLQQSFNRTSMELKLKKLITLLRRVLF